MKQMRLDKDIKTNKDAEKVANEILSDAAKQPSTPIQ